MRTFGVNWVPLICFLNIKYVNCRAGKNNQDAGCAYYRDLIIKGNIAEVSIPWSQSILEVFKNLQFHLDYEKHNNASYAEYTELKPNASSEGGKISNETFNEENGMSEKDRNYKPCYWESMTLSPEEMAQDFLELNNQTLVSQDFEIVGVKVYPYHLKVFLEEKAKIVSVRGFAKLIDFRNVQGVMQSRYEFINLFKQIISQYVFEYCSPIERLVWGTTRPIERLGYRRFEAIWKEVDLSAINATSSTRLNIDDFTEEPQEWFL